MSERIDEKVWETAKTVKISGFFVTNNTKSTIRVQTEEGSCIIRNLQSGWVWAKEIKRIFVPDKGYEWPEWNLYSEDVVEKIE